MDRILCRTKNKSVALVKDIPCWPGTIDEVAGYIKSVSVNPEVPVDRSLFPFTLPVFRDFQELAFHPSLTYFVGENGSGKSTLLEAIAVIFGFSAEGGSKKHTFATQDSHSNFFDVLRLSRAGLPRDTFFLRAESFYNVATYLEQSGGWRYGQIHKRSHGEGFLDALCALTEEGLYLLDEPESALSVVGQLSLLGIMKRHIQYGSQFIISTHSPILLGYGDGWIYDFTAHGLERTEYERTQPYLITKDFLQNRSRYAEFLSP